MAKRIEKDGRFFRERRGKLVEIPLEWVGQTTSSRSIRQRPSKLPGKLKRVVKDTSGANRYKDRRAAPVDDHDDDVVVVHEETPHCPGRNLASGDAH